MCRYKHLTLEDREGIMVMYIDGKSIADIADAIDRDKSTVSREVRRSAQGPSSKRSGYRAWRAQSDLCQDFGHASSKNQAARGISSGLGAVRSKNSSMASAGAAMSAVSRLSSSARLADGFDMASPLRSSLA